MVQTEGPFLSDVIKTDINLARAGFQARLDELSAMLPPFEGSKDEYHIPGLDDDPEVPVIEFRNRDVLHPDCAIIWLHGGGYLIGSADDLSAKGFADLAPVISVEYRMAPEHRAPAAARDACAAIERVAQSHNPRKIILAGPSAGGGLTASAAILNRDRGGPELAFQLLIYPMLDNLHDTPSGHMDIPSSTWDRVKFRCLPGRFMQKRTGAGPYAAAARAEDLSGLPPAYIMSGDLDLFLDEDIEYANRLRSAGVPVELAIYPWRSTRI